MAGIEIAKKSDLVEATNGLATTEELTSGLAGKSETSHKHSYNDLTDKPTIPSIEGLATKTEVGKKADATALTPLATKTEVGKKADATVLEALNSTVTEMGLKVTSLEEEIATLKEQIAPE